MELGGTMLKQIWTNLLGLQQLGQQGPPTQSVTGTIACKNSVCAHIKPDCLKWIASSVVQKPSAHGIWHMVIRLMHPHEWVDDHSPMWKTTFMF
jgi:hypothetical protein